MQQPRVGVMRKSPRQLMKEAESKRNAQMPNASSPIKRVPQPTQTQQVPPKNRVPLPRQTKQVPTPRRPRSEWNKEV